MKILIFGGNGMLGHKLFQVLGRRFDVWATCREISRQFENPGFADKGRLIEQVEVTDETCITKVLERIRPDVVVNAVGVIKQLPSSKDVAATFLINSIFPQRLAELSSRFGFRLIAISTDCVFDGVKGNYTETDTPNALDLYGQSKRWGEITAPNCLTIRTSIIGHELETHHSLVDWFLSNRGGAVRGYTNAIYSGFPTVVFAGIIGDLIESHRSLSGIYHVSSDPISKFELLHLINDEYEAGIEIDPDDSVCIDRSLNSAKFRDETGFVPIAWPEMIRSMKEDSAIYGRF